MYKCAFEVDRSESASFQVMAAEANFKKRPTGSPPIKGLFDTLRFRKNLTRKPLKYAFSFDEIEKKAKKYAVVMEKV